MLAVCAAAFVIGLPFENADMMGQLMDIVSIYINPLGAVIAAVIFFWVCNKKWVLDEVSKGSPKPAGEGFHNYGKYIFCGVSVLIYLINLYFVLVLKQGSIG